MPCDLIVCPVLCLYALCCFVSLSLCCVCVPFVVYLCHMLCLYALWCFVSLMLLCLSWVLVFGLCLFVCHVFVDWCVCMSCALIKYLVLSLHALCCVCMTCDLFACPVLFQYDLFFVWLIYAVCRIAFMLLNGCWCECVSLQGVESSWTLSEYLHHTGTDKSKATK